MEKIPNGLYDPFSLVEYFSQKVLRIINIDDQEIIVSVREYEEKFEWTVYVKNGHSKVFGSATQIKDAYGYTSKSNRSAFCEAYHSA